MNVKLEKNRSFLLGGAFLLFLLLFAMMSRVSAADDNTQLENYNNNNSLNIEADNTDGMEFNNTHDKIVIENVTKNVVVIRNSSPSPLNIVNSTINCLIIENSEIRQHGLRTQTLSDQLLTL